MTGLRRAHRGLYFGREGSEVVWEEEDEVNQPEGEEIVWQWVVRALGSCEMANVETKKRDEREARERAERT